MKLNKSIWSKEYVALPKLKKDISGNSYDNSIKKPC